MDAIKEFLRTRGITDDIIYKGLSAFKDAPVGDMIKYVNNFVDEDDVIYRVAKVSSL